MLYQLKQKLKNIFIFKSFQSNTGDTATYVHVFSGNTTEIVTCNIKSVTRKDSNTTDKSA